ncbi:MAG TPA: 2-(1,2-epoxy-1,2-dihydrophenyl)acetyl-CoA isomerase [Deltaproteobacteria bacterium]|jgi:2-(1,2-epoxy-1,2-dihydrophenyl)acetyl-CoA isomerase|nr:2-(1,2-epoxy-1,2-dihydrophenyl)acetyl-CoA isomerase [Deltaproteobacteria bacterium]
MAETKDQLLFELEEGVGIITLNRPDRLNAINWDLAVELVALLRELRQRDEVRTIVLTGAGRAFCSGGDAEWLSGSSERGLPGLSEVPLERYQRKTPAGPVAEVTRMLVDVDKPVIAAIAGPVMGAGLAFALACDRRIADRTTRMCAAMVRLGFAPDCGITFFLPRVTRLSTALMMVETGRILEAEECHREGLIDELVENAQALPRALSYAKELARGPSVAVDLARRFIHKSLVSTLDEMLDYEAVAATMSAHTEDAREGTRAFVEKRKPTFKGR